MLTNELKLTFKLANIQISLWKRTMNYYSPPPIKLSQYLILKDVSVSYYHIIQFRRRR